MSEIPLRRGLPREVDGEPWPISGTAPAPQTYDGDAPTQPTAPNAVVGEGKIEQGMRRGLPRVPGGEPWPVVLDRGDSPAGLAQAGATATAEVAELAVAGSAEAAGLTGSAATVGVAGSAEMAADPEAVQPQPNSGIPADSVATSAAQTGQLAADDSTANLRRGLPREVGGEPWPTEASVTASEDADTTRTDVGAGAGAGANDVTGTATAANTVSATTAGNAATAKPQRTGISQPASEAGGAGSAGDAVVPQGPKVAARTAETAKAEPQGKLYRGKPLSAWLRIVGLSAAGLVVFALIAVFGVRWLLGTGPLQDFLTRYPGEYALPANAPEGFPVWLRWSHFFNVFLMVLIIRSGWQIRTEKKPQAYWTPKWNKKRKISLTMWFHQSLDLLWIINGIVFVVLLFATGQWMRIVPTSWEVFPNALSAGLQYVSLDWPVEDGWVNYNSLQQLAYFATVFVAAPLAVISGVRMSGLWPKAPTLSKVYPIEAARAVHFPVMIYFVVFIITHVFLVLSTGALRNLNHMYTGTSEVSWVGFWLFVLSLGVIIGGVFAARALVIAPIASLFGRVGR